MTPAHSQLFILIGVGVLAAAFVLGILVNEWYATSRRPKPVKHVDLIGVRPPVAKRGGYQPTANGVGEPKPPPKEMGDNWWEGHFKEAPLVSHEGEQVWIPAVPLPVFGLLSDRCACGKRFRGNDRAAKYEAHWRNEHEPGMRHGAHIMVTVAEARHAYESARAHRESARSPV